MEYRLGTPVQTVDGENVGTVDRLVLQDPIGAAHAIVVHRGLVLTRDVLIALRFVDAVDEDGVHLAIDRKAVDGLPEFVESDFAMPATTPDGFPIGSIMYPSVFDPAVVPYLVSEENNLQPGEQDIARGHSVICEDGEIGVVHDLLVDGETGRLDALLVQTDGPMGMIQVPAGNVASIEGETVTLRGTVREILVDTSSEVE